MIYESEIRNIKEVAYLLEMSTQCRADESKSCRIHHMQWFKRPFRIPPIIHTYIKNKLSFIFSDYNNNHLYPLSFQFLNCSCALLIENILVNFIISDCKNHHQVRNSVFSFKTCAFVFYFRI